MIKNKKAISINLVSALIILICLFIGIVDKTNSWFTSSHRNGVEIVVNVGDLNLTVNQIKGNVKTEIYTNSVNQGKQDAEKSYVMLDSEIAPNVPISLNLELTNNEQQYADSMYLCFALTLYAQGVTEDTIIPIEIAGFTPANTSVAGFVKSGDYYYYALKTGDTTYKSVKFESGATKTLLTEFTVSLDEFLKLNGSETVRLELEINASSTQYTITV